MSLMTHDDLTAAPRVALEPEALFWARRRGEAKLQVVMISTVFGKGRDYWSVAVLGTDQHFALDDFEFVALAVPPST